MILERLDECSARIISRVRRSFWVRKFSHLSRRYEEWGKQKSKRRAESQPDPTAVFQQRQGLFYRVLLWQEESCLRNLGRSVFAWFCRGSLGSLGVFLLVFGGISLVGCFLVGVPQFSSVRLLCSLVCLLSATPLLLSRTSCAHGMRYGRILGGFLLGFCGLSEILFDADAQGEERLWSPLFLGSLCGVGAILSHPLYVAAIPLLVLVAALLLSVPELTVLSVCFVLPFFSLTSHPSLWLLLALLICAVTWIGKALSGKRQMRFTKTDACVLLFAILFLLGGLIGAGGAEGLRAGALRALLLLFAWFPVRGLLLFRRWRNRCIWAMLLSAFLCAVFGIWQYFSGRAVLAWVDLSRFSDIGGRVSSVFENPNMLAVFLLITAPLALGMAFSAPSPWAKMTAASVFAAESVCLVFTWSRGAWLGWGVSVLLFFLFYSRRSLSALCLLPLPLATAALYLPANLRHRFASIFHPAESSARYRLYTWQGGLRMLTDKPFGIGVGDAAFHAVFPSYAVSGTERVMHAHQLFLQIAIELGLPAVLLFLVILWRLARRSARLLVREYELQERGLALGAAFAMAGGLVMGLFDHIWYHFGLFALFWMLAAILFDLQERGEGRT